MTDAATDWTGTSESVLDYAGEAAVGVTPDPGGDPGGGPAAQPSATAGSPTGSWFPDEVYRAVREHPANELHCRIIEVAHPNMSQEVRDHNWQQPASAFADICDLAAMSLTVCAVGLGRYEGLKRNLPHPPGRRTFCFTDDTVSDGARFVRSEPINEVRDRWMYLNQQASDDDQASFLQSLVDWAAGARSGAVVQIKMTLDNLPHTFVLERAVTENAESVLLHQAYEGLYTLTTESIRITDLIESLRQGLASSLATPNRWVWTDKAGIVLTPKKTIEQIGALLFDVPDAPENRASNYLALGGVPVVAAGTGQDGVAQATPYPAFGG